MRCELCGCEEAHNFHHLIPRTLHGNKWFRKRYSPHEMRRGIDLCKGCHKAIHKMIPEEKDLGRHYHSVEKLLAHPGIAKYVAWKRKRAARRSSRSVETAPGHADECPTAARKSPDEAAGDY